MNKKILYSCIENMLRSSFYSVTFNFFWTQSNIHTQSLRGQEISDYPIVTYTPAQSKVSAQNSPHQPDLHFLMRKDLYFHVGYATKARII